MNEMVFRVADGDIISVLGQPYEIRIGEYPQISFAGPDNRGACLEGEAILLRPDATMEDFQHELTHSIKYEILRMIKRFIEDIMYERR